MCRHLEKSLDFCGTTRETACGTKAESSATPAAQPRVVGERPSVSWLVETPVVNSTRRAQIVPTLLAGDR